MDLAPSNRVEFPDGNDCRIHHIGFVVGSIAQLAPSFAQAHCAVWDGKIIRDPLQVVRVAFLSGYYPNDPLIELVEPDGAASPVLDFSQTRAVFTTCVMR